MSWHASSSEPGDLLIQNGDVVVGSIRRQGGRWFVEVLWSGPGGDIKGEFSDYAQAQAFVEGVEKTLSSLGLADPRMATGVHGEPRQ